MAYTNVGDAKMSLTPRRAPSFDDYKRYIGEFFGDTMGEGGQTFINEAIQGAGNFAQGSMQALGGIGHGLQDIVRKGYASPQSAEQLYKGGRRAIGGFVQAGWSPFNASVAALPQIVQKPVEQGLDMAAQGLDYGLDLIPNTTALSARIAGDYINSPYAQQIQQKIAQSTKSKEWKAAKGDIQNLLGAATVMNLPIIPNKLSYAVNAPTQGLIQTPKMLSKLIKEYLVKKKK